jgi:hypothetical protein
MTTLPRAGRRAAAGAALTCIAALVTACGSAGSPAAAPTVTASAGAASGPPSAPPPASPAVVPTSPPPAGPPPCPTSALHVTRGVSQGAAGSIYTGIDFTNIASTTCSLFGYPGVSFVTGTGGSQLGPAAKQNTGSARHLVVLRPGQTAHAVLQIVQAANYPAAKCQPVTAHALKIYPPNQTAPLYLGYTTQTCAKKIQILIVSAVRFGSGSSV